MTRRTHLLPGTAVSVAGELAIVPYRDLRISALQRPMRGVRSVGLDLETTIGRCTAYAAGMPLTSCFSDTTAADLLGIPLPKNAGARVIHVTVPPGNRAPEGQGVRGHQRHSERPSVRIGQLSVSHPAVVWAQLAEQLSLWDLVAAGDFLVTGIPFLGIAPLCTITELAHVVDARTRRRGSRLRVEAVGLVREGPLSRPESLVRLLAVNCGIPDPVVAIPVLNERGSKIATPDLRWPRYRTSLEYEGDHHRERGQFRYDLGRIERLADTGEQIIRAHAGDLFSEPSALVQRIGARLAARGWPGAVDVRRVIRFET